MTEMGTPALTPADDALHEPVDDGPFWTETLWLAFAVPERRLTGVLYPILRPNQNVGSLNVYLWDDTRGADDEILYQHHLWHLPMPGDLGDIDLPGRFSYRCVAPLSTYDVGYDDGVELRLKLRYEALHEPVGRGTPDAASGYSQQCHVTGSLRLNGDELTIDCYEQRASAWSTRSDVRPAPRSDDLAGAPGFSDTYASSDRSAFFVGTAGDFTTTSVYDGYLWRDGDLRLIAEGERHVTRSERGQVTEIALDAVDAAGRTLRATGSCVNSFRMVMPGFVFWCNGVDWVVDGEAMWGEDHDVPGAGGRAARHFHPTVEPT